MAVAPLTTAKTYLDALYAYARAVNERRLMARADPELLAMLALRTMSHRRSFSIAAGARSLSENRQSDHRQSDHRPARPETGT